MRSRGPHIEAIARLTGTELDPWQRHVCDVASEVDDDGHWLHRLVGVIVGRQNGKSTILEARILAGLFLFNDSKIVHTAQDRALPRQMFERLIGVVESQPALARRVAQIRETNGQEAIRLTDGSLYKIIAPRAKAIRGEYEPSPPDLIVVDEAREQHSMDLWTAALPTIRTRPSAQIWAVSNAGDADSVMLNSLRDRGRAAVADPDDDPRMAWLEWSAAGGTERPIDDPQAWAEANPALGRRISVDTIVDELKAYEDNPNGFRTEILCQWVHDVTHRAAIDWTDWLACGGEPEPVDPAALPRPVCGVDVDGDRNTAAVAIAAWRHDRLVVDVVEELVDPTVADVVRVAADWMRRYRIYEYAYDPKTSQTVAAYLDAERFTGVAIKPADYVTASSVFGDAVASRTLLHPNNETLNTQIQGAHRKPTGDGLWFISRALSDGPVTGVLAAAFATYLHYRPKPELSIA